MDLEECIDRRDINAAKLARLAGYNSAYVQRILSGRRKPGIKFLKAIAPFDVNEIKRYEDSNKNKDVESTFNVS